MKYLSTPPFFSGSRSFWICVLIGIISFLIYELHDLREPFAHGHTRWAEAYTYWFARAHMDFGAGITHGLNVEGVTKSGEPIFYLSALPLVGLVQAAVVSMMGGEYWTIRVLPLITTLLFVGLLAVFSYRTIGARAAPLAVLLLLGMPYVLEYGASNAGRLILVTAFGLAGYLGYSRFLLTRKHQPLMVSAAMFACGMCFGWHAGFMALAVIAHLWFQDLPVRSKFVATFMLGAVLGGVVIAVLLQQGFATGDFLYPLRRALERGGSPHAQGASITWTALLQLQASRYWSYYGPVVAGLSVYWFVRRLLPRPSWSTTDTWAVLAWLPGLVFGLLLRDAAYRHDFLMLGFLPGAVLIATLGLLNLMDDLERAPVARPKGKRVAALAAGLLLGIHAVGAVRSAQSFERQEHADLVGGAARLAWYLRQVPDDGRLMADWSVGMASRVDGRTGERYVSLQPFIDYLVRRPVRVVSDVGDLRKQLCKAGQPDGKLILLQAKKEENAGAKRARIVDGVAVGKVAVPPEWISRQQDFDNVRVLHLNTLAAPECIAGQD